MTLPLWGHQPCLGCGSELEARATVCPGCATPVGAGERRLVTLLFADLEGYTALCAQRDPEEVHLFVRPLMNSLRKVCESVGGVVPSIEGDGFMAVFGARHANEDDPIRALSAAVQMLKEVAARRSVLSSLGGLHVGIHLGEVVVTPSWEASELAVSGDAVNVASRMCDVAPVGGLLASAALVKLSGHSEGWGPAQELLLRGRPDPVTVHSFQWQEFGDAGPGPRWSASTPYVERRELEEAFDTALLRGPVAVVGVGGCGKSRLVAERLRARRHMRQHVTIRPDADLWDVLADVASKNELAGPLVTRLQAFVPAEGDAQDLLRAVALHIRRADAVLVLEDAELLPVEGDQLLGELASALGDALVVVSRRAHPASGLPVVEVPPLSAEHAGHMVDRLLPGASATLRGHVLSRAGDSPLFLEQCVTLLLESGAVEVTPTGSRVVDADLLDAVPTSMRLFVASRLDLLRPDVKDAIGVAAVLGDAPDLHLLSHLLGGRSELVEELVERDLLRWTTGPLEQPALVFSHLLVRDIAYEGLLRRRRVEIHRAAASWYAVLPVVHVLEAQAYHLEAAVQLGDSDCDLVRQAVDALVLFARSVEEERPRAAQNSLQQARLIVDRRPECRCDELDLHLGWTRVQELTGDEEGAVRSGRAALALATERGDAVRQAEARLLLGRAYRDVDPAAADATLQSALQAYERLGDLSGQARVEIERGFLADRTAGNAALAAAFARAYSLAIRSGDARLQAQAAQQLAFHHAMATGTHEFEHWAALAEATSRTDDIGLTPRLALSRAVLAYFGCHPETGRVAVAEALSSARELGLSQVHGNALIFALELAIGAGRLNEAREQLPEAHSRAASRPRPFMQLQVQLAESRLLLREGRINEARSLLADVSRADASHEAIMHRDLCETQAWLSLESGHFGEASSWARRALEVDEVSGELPPQLRSRFIDLVARVASQDPIPLADVSSLRGLSRELGLPVPAALAGRWLNLDEATHGWSVDRYGLQALDDVVEARALDLELGALVEREPARLLDAVDEWSRLGDTVWQARAMVWHAELTGTDHPAADALLARLQAPAGLADAFRSQVQGLRG